MQGLPTIATLSPTTPTAPTGVLVETAQRALLHLPSKLASPDERLFWPYLVGALALSAVYWRLRVQGSGAPSWRRWLMPAGWWRAPSVRADLWLALIWGVLRTVGVALLLAPPVLLTSIGAVLWIIATLDRWLGPAQPLDLPRAVVPWLYGAALFITWDLSRYGLHRLLHRVDALWRFHQVHHSATVLTPLTLHRSHPVEAALYASSQWLVTVLLTAFAVRWVGAGAVPVEVLGVNAFGFACSLLGGNLRHGHAPLAYPRWLERWLVSPAQHQLHHSVDPALQRSNYGVWLACWDRMAGSLRHGDAEQRVTFGVHTNALNHDPERAISALIGPFRRRG